MEMLEDRLFLSAVVSFDSASERAAETGSSPAAMAFVSTAASRAMAQRRRETKTSAVADFTAGLKRRQFDRIGSATSSPPSSPSARMASNVSGYGVSPAISLSNASRAASFLNERAV